MSRTTEFVLGLIGGIVAFGGAFFALAFGAMDKAVSGSGTISGLGVAAFVFAAVSIVGAIVAKLKPRLGGEKLYSTRSACSACYQRCWWCLSA
ncbi:MAG: DUF4064 domain-containing protein [Firmicutes bacterium]|nr:DUF4064 domain-containing protein [Bacillota bacterium]